MFQTTFRNFRFCYRYGSSVALDGNFVENEASAKRWESSDNFIKICYLPTVTRYGMSHLFDVRLERIFITRVETV